MTAYVNPDGISGYLLIDTDKFETTTEIDKNDPDWSRTTWEFDKVGDVDLKDIIKFTDGGHVTRISGSKTSDDNYMKISVRATGPSTLTGIGHLTFMDDSGHSDDLSIWIRQYQSFFSSDLKPVTWSTKVKLVEWHS